MGTNTFNTTRPIPTNRRTHYFQGRPNTVFLHRYGTLGTDRAVRPA